MNLEDGKRLVSLARAAIEGKELRVKGFEERQGVFVTLSSYPGGQLRGCIGFPQPVMPLREAIVKAAKAAAFSDPRFRPLGKSEQYTVEVSVLTVPELVTGNIPGSFKVGIHGLIVQHKNSYGLLLPQVFTGVTPVEALEMACEKAGLGRGAWKEKGCRVYKFRAEVFAEEAPCGKVR